MPSVRTRHPIAVRFRLPAIALLATLAYGVAGYRFLFGWDLVDAAYMTVTTLTTVGFREVRELSDAGRLFTISVVLSGVVTLFVAVAVGAEALASGELTEFTRTRRTRRRMEKLGDHFVICAYGRVGRAAADELDKHGLGYAIVDVKGELEPLLVERGCPYLIGDPTDEDVLREAGIMRARGLLCAVDSDASNVFITLTARAIKPDLYIVARASDPDSIDKLERAGADRVVSPYALSGRRMALLATQPSMREFFDVEQDGSRLEEIEVRSGSHLAGRTVGEVTSSHDGVTIMAIKKGGAELSAPPAKSVRIEEGDLLLVIGPPRSLHHMAG